MEFLSAYNFSLSYRRGKDNANADFLSRLPLPPTNEDISGSCALTDPDDLGIYLIRACGLVPSFCPIPGIGLGGLAPQPRTPSLALGGLVPQPDNPLLGGLPLSNADFRTHNAPLPPVHMVGSIARSTRAPTRTPNTIYTLENTRPPPTGRTRSQSALLAGSTPTRPDYRLAARSGFAASAASAPPSLRTSPPPRSARLGSTTSDRPASAGAAPTSPVTIPDSLPLATLDPSPPEQAPDSTVETAISGLSDSLLSFVHREWEQDQRDDPLCNAVRRYLQLGCPQPLPPTLFDHIASHKRLDPADITNIAACQPSAYTAPLAAPQPQLQPDSTALVASLVFSIRPIRPQLVDNLGLSRPHGPRGHAGWQPSAFTAPFEAQPRVQQTPRPP